MTEPTTEASPYARAVENYSSLRAFLPRFRESRVYLQASQPVTPRITKELGPTSAVVASNRDRAVCALINKAANTHAAIKTLTDAGHGDDATALGRVLLENVALLRWLLLDKVYRLDLYCISDALFRSRYLRLIEEHYSSKPDLVRRAKESYGPDEQKVASFFGETKHKWAKLLHPGGKTERVVVEGMFAELAGGSTNSHVPNFPYDVIYFMQSGYVHSTASVMRSFSGLREESFFTIELGPHSTRVDEALGGANIFFWQGLRAVSDYTGLSEIADDLDTFFEKLLAAVVS